jgi:hypothetical protein
MLNPPPTSTEAARRLRQEFKNAELAIDCHWFI